MYRFRDRKETECSIIKAERHKLKSIAGWHVQMMQRNRLLARILLSLIKMDISEALPGLKNPVMKLIAKCIYKTF
jgi:hypothetical protein